MKELLSRFKIHKVHTYIYLYVVTAAIILSSLYFVPIQNRDFPLFRGIIVFFASILLIKYFFYMALSPWHDVLTVLKRKKFAKSVKAYNPLVSVMIPAWNEEVGILHSIESLLQATYRNMEIIVVNDGSTDNSHEVITEFIEKYDKLHVAHEKRIKIKYKYKKNEGKGAALNTAIELAEGEILVSIDADCIVTPDAIGEFVEAFADPKVMAAVGNVKVGNKKTVVGMIQYLEFLFSFYFKKADSLLNTIYIIGGAAGAFRRDVLTSLGGYSAVNITEDIDLSMRIQDAGMKIVYVDDAIVYTEGASNVDDLKKQRLRWKRGRFETFFNLKHMFFSLKKRHNKLLSWVILPLGYLGELQLSLEIMFISFLYIYSLITHDFSSFISGIVVVATMFLVQMFFDDPKTKRPSFYLLLPIAWILFYLTTYVEITALRKSLWGLLRGKELKWQKWDRKGVGKKL